MIKTIEVGKKYKSKCEQFCFVPERLSEVGWISPKSIYEVIKSDDEYVTLKDNYRDQILVTDLQFKYTFKEYKEE